MAEVDTIALVNTITEIKAMLQVKTITWANTVTRVNNNRNIITRASTITAIFFYHGARGGIVYSLEEGKMIEQTEHFQVQVQVAEGSFWQIHPPTLWTNFLFAPSFFRNCKTMQMGQLGSITARVLFLPINLPGHVIWGNFSFCEWLLYHRC